MPTPFRPSGNPSLEALAFISALLSSTAAMADTYQAFAVSGTLQSGATFSGTLTLDIPAKGVPSFVNVVISVSGAQTAQIDQILSQGDGSGEGNTPYVEVVLLDDTGANTLDLFLQAPNSLVGYAGGGILPTVTEYGLTYSSGLVYYVGNNQVETDLESGSVSCNSDCSVTPGILFNGNNIAGLPAQDVVIGQQISLMGSPSPNPAPNQPWRVYGRETTAENPISGFKRKPNDNTPTPTSGQIIGLDLNIKEDA